MSLRSVAGVLVGLLVLLACAGRLIYLDADPSFPTWIGYVADEGRWSETARNVALFGDPDVNWFSRLHLFLSPGYQAVNYIAFLAFGVDFWSARIFAAVAGVLVVLTVFLALRRHVTTFALAFGIVVLGFETNVLGLSRLALPEMPAVLATLLAFLFLVLGRRTLWSAALAGLIAVAAVAMKGSSVLVLLIFPVIALLVPQQVTVRGRIARSAVFVAAFALPVTAGLIGLFALGYLKAAQVIQIAGTFFDFLSLTGPYPTVSRFLDSTEHEARNLLLLGVWFSSWLWFYRQPRSPSVASELYLASGVWAGWWLIVWSANAYLPGRYLVHFIVPATIHIMAGLSLGERDTVGRIVSGLAQYRRIKRAAVLSWLVLPSAIVLSSVIAAAAGIGGLNADRLSERVAIVVALTGLLASCVSVRQVTERSIVGFLSFPVAMTLFWLAGRELGLFAGFWGFDSVASVAIWSTAAGVAFVLCFVLAPQLRERLAVAGAAAVALLAAIFVAQAAPPILFPTYSLRDASRDLPQHLPVGHPIRTVTAASLFLENGIKYHELWREDEQIDGLVVFKHGGVARRFLNSKRATRLVQVHAYPLTVSPRYLTADGRHEVPVVGIYRAK